MSSITSKLNNTMGTSSSSGKSQAEIIAANESLIAGNAAPAKSEADKLMGTTDQFLSLLLAQLKYQDPTQPMKGTEFIDSISRLSTVEQGINTNKNLENISTILKGNNGQLGSPVSYIDKTIDFNSSQFALTNKVGNFSYNLDATNPPEVVHVVIKDSTGKAVVTMDNKTMPALDGLINKAGLNTVKWDGTDDSGNQLKDGLYTVSVSYDDPKSKDPKKPTAIEVSTFVNGKVTGADFTSENPILNVGKIQIPLTAVRTLYGSST